MTILLSLTVFLNMVSETMPVTSDNPLLGNFSIWEFHHRQTLLLLSSNCYHVILFSNYWSNFIGICLYKALVFLAVTPCIISNVLVQLFFKFNVSKYLHYALTDLLPKIIIHFGVKKVTPST